MTSRRYQRFPVIRKGNLRLTPRRARFRLDTTMTTHVWINTSLGSLFCGFEKGKLTELHFDRRRKIAALSGRPDWIAPVQDELDGYLSGRSRCIRIPYRLTTGTEFERRVWEVTATIPYGEVRTYGWLADQVGRPRGARAVGQALGKNPLPLVIPCHRVVAAGGRLGGFTGGLDLKRRLLLLEGVHLSSGDCVLSRKQA